MPSAPVVRYNCDTAWDVITMSTSAGYRAVKVMMMTSSLS
jgi:hypothetical protein